MYVFCGVQNAGVVNKRRRESSNTYHHFSHSSLSRSFPTVSLIVCAAVVVANALPTRLKHDGHVDVTGMSSSSYHHRRFAHSLPPSLSASLVGIHCRDFFAHCLPQRAGLFASRTSHLLWLA
ncbi:hypothetical protein BDZ89DRAFT_201823 [Hymenopellis radicata]|nr:hypothetical protein BDZ89DRAFT_201823 [Hymenopellis radicata]